MVKFYKFLWIFVLAAILLAGCEKTAADPTIDATVAAQPPTPTTTVMVYMIGSDLEAKAGSGTKDLAEMAASGVDLEHVNLVVYAGGSPHWHNEAASSEEHRVLSLGAEGFTAVSATDPASMGGSECLANFLNYAYANYPADQYALILWDHGDGPVIGYGRDMLFDNDSLTLSEMEQALAASPFSEENQLAWVGFDACLMASAELSCVWAPYAQYLVASQEVEPSFGWNYSFLSAIGTMDTPSLLQHLTETYLSACLEYYESRGYDHRDTTLSCMDLSQAAELNAAIDDLFVKASGDVAVAYNDLAARRVQTRALGRASTGSEYDLIDLYDLASQLADVYPTEAARVQAAVDSMVLSNSTNAEGCCGLSLYYPFYNKTYFTDSWYETYSSLGLFPNYQAYLQDYQATWLSNDLLATVATSQMPSISAQAQYVLELTPEQADAYASCQYYILRREGHDLYTRIFSSQDVTLQGNTLTANYDGDILYVRDEFGAWNIPLSIEHDSTGSVTRYSVPVNLSNTPSWGYLVTLDDFQQKVEGYRFHLAVDNQTKEISLSALTPWEEEMDADALAGGKSEDVDLSGWTNYTFVNQRNRYLTRYDNGVIQPVNAWPDNGWISYYAYPIGNGLEFFFAPLVAGEYYLLFEIEDTQGNRYCSELLPIQADGEEPPVNRPDPIKADFSTGDRVLLAEQAGLEIYMILYDYFGEPKYSLEITNHNDFPIYVSGTRMFINEDISCVHGTLGYHLLEAGATSTPSSINFDVMQNLYFPEGLESIQFTLNIENALTQTSIMFDQVFNVKLHDQLQLLPDPYLANYYRFDLPYRDILAPEQVLLENDQMRITLLGLGGNEDSDSLHGAVCMENLTDETIYLGPNGASFDGIFVSVSGGTFEIPPHCKVYDNLFIDCEDLDASGITSAREASLLFQAKQTTKTTGGGGFAQQFILPIVLSEKGSAAHLQEGSRVLFNEDGIRITYLYQEESYSGYYWYITVENTTDRYISLDLANETVNGRVLENGEYAGQAVYDSELGPGQCRIAKLAYLNSDVPFTEMSFCFQVLDFSGETILYTGQTPITITLEN